MSKVTCEGFGGLVRRLHSWERMKHWQPTDQTKPAIKMIKDFDKGACELHLDEALEHNSFHPVLILGTDFMVHRMVAPSVSLYVQASQSCACIFRGAAAQKL